MRGKTAQQFAFLALIAAFIGGLAALAVLAPPVGPLGGTRLDLAGRLAVAVAHRVGCKGCDLFYPAAIGGLFTRYPLLMAVPSALVFLLGLSDIRSPWRVEHLDLLALAGFFPAAVLISANLSEAGLLIASGCLLWLFVRLAGVALGRFALPELRPALNGGRVVGAVMALLLFRLLVAMLSGTQLDVGVASAMGAYRLLHGLHIYGGPVFWHVAKNANLLRGDTYGPVSYYAYLPSVLAFGGPSHPLSTLVASAAFDLASIAGLDKLGRKLGGEPLGHAFAFAYVLYPFAALPLFMQTNDALIAALLIWALVALERPVTRGILLACAALTKFLPALVCMVLLARKHGRRAYAASLVASSALLMLYPLLSSGLRTFWERTFVYQAQRGAPFSFWSYAPGFAPVGRALWGAAVIALAVYALWRARPQSLRQWSALAGALLVGGQLALGYWSYLYIIWFYPLLIVAFVAAGREPAQAPEGARAKSCGA